MKPAARTVLVIVAAAVAIAIPTAQALTQFGMSAGEFSFQGDSTLRVAGYAFSIWGLLYIGMLTFGIYQALPSTPESPTLSAFAWPSIIAMAGCGFWIAAAALNAKWATVAIIATSAFALIFAMLRAPRHRSRAQFWCIILPMSLLAGWLTIATAVNALTVLTIAGAITSESATQSALIGIAIATIFAALVALRAGNAAYLLPIIWGLAGAYAIESNRNTDVANAVTAALALLALLAIGIILQRLSAARKEPEIVAE